MAPCTECLRVVCMCRYAETVDAARCYLRPKSPFLCDVFSAAAVAMVVVARACGFPPLIETILAVWLSCDAAPLHRQHMIGEALVYTILVKCLPFVGWRAGLLCCRAMLGAILAHVLLGQRSNLGRVSYVDGVVLSTLCCLLLWFKPLDDGIGVESILGLYVFFMALIALGERSPVDSERKIKYLRCRAISKLLSWLLLQTGLIFAFPVKDKDDSSEQSRELDVVEEEFAMVPQHFGSVVVLVLLFGLYGAFNIPVPLMAAAAVVAHLLVLMCDARAAQWVTLRVRYNSGALKATELISRSATALVEHIPAMHEVPLPPETLFASASVLCVLCAWAAASLIWSLVLPTVLLGAIHCALFAWLVCASLSQKMFSLAFTTMCVVSSALAFACCSVFYMDELEATRFLTAAAGPPLMLCAWALFYSNDVLFFRVASATKTAKHSTDPRRPRPRRKR